MAVFIDVAEREIRPLASSSDVIRKGSGGGRNKYLNQMTANACQLPVKAELTEATVTGNAIVQAISSGRFANLSEARNYMSERIRLKECFPQSSANLKYAKQRYKEVENFYLKNH